MPQVRAGTGGEEAALWAADLIRMYQKYADGQVSMRFLHGHVCTHDRHGMAWRHDGMGLHLWPHRAWHGMDGSWHEPALPAWHGSVAAWAGLHGKA